MPTTPSSRSIPKSPPTKAQEQGSVASAPANSNEVKGIQKEADLNREDEKVSMPEEQGSSVDPKAVSVALSPIVEEEAGPESVDLLGLEVPDQENLTKPAEDPESALPTAPQDQIGSGQAAASD